MSYCVNCGVELDSSLKKCPLCNTPVINPSDLEKLKKIQSPYPASKGIVEFASKKDIIIVLTALFGCTAASCGLLNAFVFNDSKWSLIVTGICGLLWMITVPPLLVQNFKKRIYVIYNGIMICIFLALIGLVVDAMDWVIQLGIPITVMTMLAAIIFLSVGKIKRGFLPLGITLFIVLAVECAGIDLLVDNATGTVLGLDWSAIVIAVFSVLTIVFISIVSRKKLRNQLHRRFHM